MELLLLPTVLPPDTFVGVRTLPRCVLLHGPPGTGKTLLVGAAARASHRALFRLRPSDVLSKWSGEGEKAVRTAFAAAAAAAPALLFIDELDALAPARSDGGSEASGGGGGSGSSDIASRRLLSELLQAMSDLRGETVAERAPPAATETDGSGSGSVSAAHARAAPREVAGGADVLVLGATNRLRDIDTALLRRFDRIIACPLPDECDRCTLLAHYLAGVAVAPELAADGIRLVASATDGWSAADLRALVQQAAMQPVRAAATALLAAAVVGTYLGRECVG